MTSQEFVDAVRSVGIKLEPEPNTTHDVQYRSPDDPEYAEVVRASVTRIECQILAALAEGKRVLEIGTGLGVSTACMATTAHSVVTVDPSPWVRSALKFPSNVTQLESIEDTEGSFDMAFVDGLHDYDNVQADILDCLARVRPGGMIVFHDICQHDVNKAVSEIQWEQRQWHDTVGHLTACVVPS